MDVWCVYAFILCLCCPVFRQRPCEEPITCPWSPTVCKMIMKLKSRGQGPQGLQSQWKKNVCIYIYIYIYIYKKYIYGDAEIQMLLQFISNNPQHARSKLQLLHKASVVTNVITIHSNHNCCNVT
jgi:hypothetical protein